MFTQNNAWKAHTEKLQLLSHFRLGISTTARRNQFLCMENPELRPVAHRLNWISWRSNIRRSDANKTGTSSLNTTWKQALGLCYTKHKLRINKPKNRHEYTQWSLSFLTFCRYMNPEPSVLTEAQQLTGARRPGPARASAARSVMRMWKQRFAFCMRGPWTVWPGRLLRVHFDVRRWDAPLC